MAVRRRSALAATLLAVVGFVLPGLPFDGSPLTPPVAALSDSQGRIVFVGTLDRPEQDVYSMNPDGTDVDRLTDESSGGGTPIVDDDPTWKPNGGRIAFSSNRHGNPELYAMDADGSDVDRVTNDPALDEGPTWSGDGARIAFARAEAGTPNQHRIAVVDADGTDLAILTTGTTDDVDPAWSQGGTRIAFIRDGRLTVMNADGTAVTTLVSTLTQAAAPAWSPDGNKLAFSATVAGRSDVYTVNSSGSGLLKLTGSSFAGSEPHWSPDGTRIVFTGRTSSGTSIATVLANGTCPTHLRSAPEGEHVGAPDWQSLASAPLFISAAPGCQIVLRGQSTTFGIGLSWTGTRSPVSLDVDGLPAGTSAKFGPNPAWLTTATLTVSTSECGSTPTPLGTHTLTITGWVGAMIRTTTVNLVVKDGPPKVTAPTSALESGTKLTSTAAVRTSWSACDHNAIESYRAARQSPNNWTTVSNGSATSVSESLTIDASHRYRALSTEATFPGGSPWAYGPTFQARKTQETSVAFTGTWTKVSNTKFSGNAARYATAAGAAATYSFTGSSVGWVTHKGPNRGAANVYVDGALVRTVDLHAPELKPKRVVFAHSWPAAGRHTVRVVVLGTAGRPRVDVDAFVTLVTTSAYIKNTWNGHMTTERPENITCVSASALTWSNYTWGTTSGEYYSHTIAWDWYREVRTANQDFHNKYDYSGIEPGLDPRGWAWLMWRHAPPGRSYHDYWSSSQAAVNAWMVWNIREANEPAGALTFRSVHAVDVVGFSSNIDPRNGVYTLNGFFVVDPWYPNSAGTMNDGGTLGLVPNTYITLNAWNRSYFLPYVDKPYEAVHGNNLWHRKYVAVLRSADGSPQPTKSFDTMPPTFSGIGPSSAAPSEAVTPAADPVFEADDALGAVTSGIALNGLAADARVGLEAGPIEVGRKVDVESLSPDMPPYSLVEVVQGGRVVAMAMLTRSDEGLQFAGLQAAYPGNELLAMAEAKRTFSGAGVDVRSMRLVWRPSPESLAPFSPFWDATDTAGRHRYLTPAGDVRNAIEAATSR